MSSFCHCIPAEEDSTLPKSGSDDVSLKLTSLSVDVASGKELDCRESQTEGATAKVIILIQCLLINAAD